MNAQNDDVRGPFSQLAFCRFSFEAPLFIIELPVVSKKLISFVEKSSWSNFKYFELQGYVYPVQEHVVTLCSRLFEPALIRIIWSFEVRWRSPWICLPNSSKNTLGYSNFSYSNFQLFEAISVPPGANQRLKHPHLFEFLILGDRRVRTLRPISF